MDDLDDLDEVLWIADYWQEIMEERSLVTKRAKRQIAGGYVPGSLRVYATCFKWDGIPSSTSTLDVPLNSITSERFVLDSHVIIHPISGLVRLDLHTDQQKVKGKPFLRLICGQASHVFEFDTEADRDMFIDTINRAQSGPGAPSRQLKESVFKEQPDVKGEYDALVVTGALTEVEFWAPRAALLAAHATSTSSGGAGHSLQPAKTLSAGRTLGISNMMLDMNGEQDARAATVGRTKINLVFTKEMFQQIFAERPHIKRAYDKNVPHNMSEVVFWTRYAKYEKDNESKRKRLLEGQVIVDTPADENTQLFRPPRAGTAGAALAAATMAAARINPHLLPAAGGVDGEGDFDEGRQRKAKAARVNPVVNLFASVSDSASAGHGLVHDPMRDVGLPSIAEDLVRDINRHAEVVLAGVDAMASAGSITKASSSAQALPEPASLYFPRPREALDLEDLRQMPEKEHEPLSIPDPSRYFDQQAPGPPAIPDPGIGHISKPLSSALNRLSSMDLDRLSAGSVGVMEPLAAYQTLLECSRGSAAAAGMAEEPDAPVARADPGEVLAPELLSDFRAKAIGVNELCRCFWATCPADTPAKKDLLRRLHKAADALYESINQMRSIAQQGPERPVIRMLLVPIRDMLDKMMDRFTESEGLV